MEIKQFISTLNYSLSRSPSTAGKRLRSERELSSIFNVGEAQVRKVLSKLVDNGVLIRKRGSGTYVRRVSDLHPDNHKLPPAYTEKAGYIFADSKLKFSNGTESSSPQLHIGLWGDIGYGAMIDQYIIGAISKSVNAAGHRFTLHNTVKDFQTGERIPAEQLRQQIENNPCDGYLVVDTIADSFQKAIGNAKIPTVYFLGGSVDIDYEPIVMFDTFEAIERAVRVFHKQGYDRIGIIACKREWDNPYPNGIEDVIYDNVMSRLGLSYRACEFSESGVGQAMQATRKLFNRPDPPKAIYVTDDNILVGVSEAFALQGIVPGRDVAVITLSNKNFPLPPGRNWSRMEFDRERLAKVIVDNLLYQLQTTTSKANTITIHASWVPADTHLIKNKENRIPIVEFNSTKDKKNPENCLSEIAV